MIIQPTLSPEVLIWLFLTTSGILISLRTLRRLQALLGIQLDYPESVAEVVAMSRHNIFAERARLVAHVLFWAAGLITFLGLPGPPSPDRALADYAVVWALVGAYTVLVANSANELWLAEKLWGRRLVHLARMAKQHRTSLPGRLAVEAEARMARERTQPPADRPSSSDS